MKTLATLLFLALSLGANAFAQPTDCSWVGMDCSLSYQGCDQCHFLAYSCNPSGCIDCNQLCWPIAQLTAQAKADLRAKQLRQARLNPARLNDAGKLWDILSSHLTSMQPVPKIVAGYHLPPGHPSTLATRKPDPVRCANKSIVAEIKLNLAAFSVR